MIFPPETESSWFGIGGLATALVSAVGWWFHVRRLARADKIDGGVTKSLEFVLNALRAEIAANHMTILELRARIIALETQNEAQHQELRTLRGTIKL